MYYIKNGLGKSWKWLGVLFAIFGALAAFGIGNMTQINTIASTVTNAVNTVAGGNLSDSILKALPWVISIICAIITAIVIIGGIQRLSDVCALMVPVMAVIYIVAAFGVIFLNISEVPAGRRWHQDRFHQGRWPRHLLQRGRSGLCSHRTRSC